VIASVSDEYSAAFFTALRRRVEDNSKAYLYVFGSVHRCKCNISNIVTITHFLNISTSCACAFKSYYLLSLPVCILASQHEVHQSLEMVTEKW